MPYAEVNGTTLYYEDNGGGPAVLFVHGWGTSGRVWNAQLPALVGSHRVVTTDWRGCGRSAHPVAGNTIATLAGDVAALAAYLGLERTVLVGSSTGGAIVLEAARLAPAAVAAVVPVDAGMHLYSQGMAEAMAELRAGLAQDRAGTLARIVPGWTRPDASPALTDWIVGQILDSGVFVDGVIDDQARYDPRPYLSTVATPTVFLHGELDTEIPLAVPRECAALMPHAEVVVVPGAGHMSQMDNPAAFDAALRKVLDAVSTAPWRTSGPHGARR